MVIKFNIVSPFQEILSLLYLKEYIITMETLFGRYKFISIYN